MARVLKPLTIDVLQDEVRFLLKTLLRDDLFGDVVGISEAEKLLESSLSASFVDYCAFLKRHAFLEIDRAKSTISVLPRGKNYADGNTDPSLGNTLSSHFAKQLGAQAAAAPTPPAPAPPAPAPPAPALPLSFGSAAPLPTFSSSLSADTVVKARPVVAEAVARQKAAAMAQLERERYVRGELIGNGSLGAVLLGKDTTLERDVVIKEVRHVYELVTYLSRDELTTRIKAAVMAQVWLDHPHVLRVVDVQFGGDVPTIVLDRAVESLATRVGRGLMPVDVCIRAFLQICYALAHAHAQGVLHAGLKPENVLFDKCGNVKLADFGIARVTERPADPNTSAPPVYVGRGHPSYMAPEQLHKGKVSPAADVYALGILLYEMLTGILPGRRSPMPSASERVVNAVGTETAAAIDDLFDRMTRDPLPERYTTIEEVLKALYTALPASMVGTPGTLLLSEIDPLAPFASPVHNGTKRDFPSENSGIAEISAVPVAG